MRIHCFFVGKLNVYAREGSDRVIKLEQGLNYYLRVLLTRERDREIFSLKKKNTPHTRIAAYYKH
jgi:hypothetical protein